MSELAYSLHLGGDKNRKNISKQNGKNNISVTTSLPNNAIQNVRQLSEVDKHNYRKYDNNQELIEIVRGTSSPLNDVKELYLIEFEESRLEYNSKQSRLSRMIDNYFENVSNNEKKDLACEIILELGDKEYWDTKDKNFKMKMSEVYKKQVNDLELLVPNFKIASAIIHFDETSPHLHIVGVPIKYKNKNGMEKQVDNTNDEYAKIQTLSNTLINANEELKNKDKQIIKTLSENNKALDLRVDTLNNTIKEKDNEISFLKSKINDLKDSLEYWKDKFEKIISFLHNKLHSWYDKDDKYIDMVNDMYEDNVLDDDDIKELDLNKEKDVLDDDDIKELDLNKEKDVFEK